MHRVAVIGVIVWGVVVGSGFVALQVHEATPGSPGRPVERWPSASVVPQAEGRPTLVMAAHPRCPCTRASVAELARVLSRCEGRLGAVVLVFTPKNPGLHWGPPDWSSRLAAIPGVRLIDDPGGREAARFGARTSGHVVLYSPDGRLLYRGGVTGGRGHEGGNAGAEAIVSLVRGGLSHSAKGPVFGCPIF